MKKYLLILTLALFALPLASVLAQAQGPTITGQSLDTCPGQQGINGGCAGANLPYTPLEPIPGITSGSASNPTFDPTQPGQLPQLISAVFKILITVGALLAVLMLTIGGVQYMVAGGAVLKTQGIQRAQAALWGLLLVAASWLILNTINPQLLSFTYILCPAGTTCTVYGNPAQQSPPSPAALPSDLAQAVNNVSTAQLNSTDCTDARNILNPNQASCFTASGIKSMLSQGISCSTYQSQIQQEQAALQQYVNRCANAGL